MLTSAEIRALLELLAHETVVDNTADFPFRIVRRVGGYSQDPAKGKLQAKLSVMLEVAMQEEGESL